MHKAVKGLTVCVLYYRNSFFKFLIDLCYLKGANFSFVKKVHICKKKTCL